MYYLKNRRIVVDILTIFFVLMISTTAIIITYSYIKTKDTFLEMASNLIKQEHNSTIETLNQILTPIPFIKTTGYLIQDGSLSLSDIKSLTAFMYIILSSYPEFNSAYLADHNGNVFLETRYNTELAKKKAIGFTTLKNVPEHTEFISQIVSNKNNKGLLNIIYKTKTGEIIKQETIDTEYNPTIRPWYIGAKNNLDHLWLGVYQFFDTDELGLTISAALRSANNLQGVLAADLSLDVITNHLEKISKNKHVFVITNNNKIIASDNQQHTSAYVLADISQIKNPIISQAFLLHQNLKQNKFIFDLNNIEYIAYFTAFAFSKNDQWQIASVVPIDFFVGPIKTLNRNNAIFSALILFFGLILVIIASRNISKPIMQLAKETKEMINLNFASEIIIPTHIYEVQVMLEAINKAKKALSSFSKYIPRALVEQLLEKNMVARLGGERKNLTVLFTDIANFTRLSENIDPEYLMIHLSEYLDHLTNIIHLYKGNIDKYIGDAIMAFWGAPIDNPLHLENACQALLACRHASNLLNEKWSQENKPNLFTRFGLSTGELIVGNVGSSDRLNYTVIGDIVNLAARLEAINKNYGTQIIVSASVFKQCKDQFLFRPLDKVKITGKKYSKIIYELVASQSPDSPYYATDEQMLLCELSAKGFAAFSQLRINDALTIYKNLHQKFPNDNLSQLYIKRCLKWLQDEE